MSAQSPSTLGGPSRAVLFAALGAMCSVGCPCRLPAQRTTLRGRVLDAKNERAIGYDPISTRLTFAANDSIDSDFMLSVITLATVRVNAKVSERFARQLQGFDERRALGFGRFLDGAFFEKNDGRNVGVRLIGRIAGTRTDKSGSRLQRERSPSLCEADDRERIRAGRRS